jgi:hypothetical protein
MSETIAFFAQEGAVEVPEEIFKIVSYFHMDLLKAHLENELEAKQAKAATRRNSITVAPKIPPIEKDVLVNDL